jgi:hypothetical protein
MRSELGPLGNEIVERFRKTFGHLRPIQSGRDVAFVERSSATKKAQEDYR